MPEIPELSPYERMARAALEQRMKEFENRPPGQRRDPPAKYSFLIGYDDDGNKFPLPADASSAEPSDAAPTRSDDDTTHDDTIDNNSTHDDSADNDSTDNSLAPGTTDTSRSTADAASTSDTPTTGSATHTPAPGAAPTPWSRNAQSQEQ